MDLYKIQVRHFSQKDSHESIECYLLAENDIEVYHWVNEEKEFGCWEDRNDDDGRYRELMISEKGEFNYEYADTSDLYYGKTHFGWEKISCNISSSDINTMKNIGISLFTVEPTK